MALLTPHSLHISNIFLIRRSRLLTIGLIVIVVSILAHYVRQCLGLTFFPCLTCNFVQMRAGIIIFLVCLNDLLGSSAAPSTRLAVILICRLIVAYVLVLPPLNCFASAALSLVQHGVHLFFAHSSSAVFCVDL